MAVEASLCGDKRRDTRGKTRLAAVGRAVAARAPGLRNALPERIDVFGTPQEQRATTVINPGIGSPAKERRDPMVREVLEAGVRMNPRQQAKGESDADCRRRVRVEGTAIKSRLAWLMGTERYRGADKEQRKDMIEDRTGRVRAEQTRMRAGASR